MHTLTRDLASLKAGFASARDSCVMVLLSNALDCNSKKALRHDLATSSPALINRRLTLSDALGRQ